MLRVALRLWKLICRHNRAGMGKIKEILFDCDGTLVDSEIIAMRVAAEILIAHVERQKKDHDFTVMGIIREFAGWHFDKMIGEVGKRAGVKIDAVAATEEKVGSTLDALRSVQAINGMNDVIVELSSRYGVSVVTSSEFSRVNLCLEVTGLDVHFPVTRKFSAHDTLQPPKHKPAPDIYLHALNEVGAAADEAVAIEDSLSGVKSAVAAKVPVIGFVGASHIGEDRAAAAQKLMEAGAKLVIEDMRDLPAAVKWIENPKSSPKFAFPVFFQEKPVLASAPAPVVAR